MASSSSTSPQHIMSSRINPLHTPVSDNRLSTYSSLLPAHSDHSVSPGRQLDLRIPVIPYPRHSSRSPVVEPHHVIYFDDATRTSRQGFSMAALTTLPLSTLAEQLHAPGEHVLADAGVERILLRIIVSIDTIFSSVTLALTFRRCSGQASRPLSGRASCIHAAAQAV